MGPDEAIAYLMARGLIRARHVVEGELRVEDVSRRNRNLRVAATLGNSFLLKQADHNTPHTKQTIAAEGRFYIRASSEKRFVRLRPFLPPFHLYDARRNVLVLGFCAGRHPDGMGSDAEQSTWFARTLAIALARCHRTTRFPGKPGRGPPLWYPWALSVAAPRPETLRSISAGQLEIVRLIQADANAAPGLDDLLSRWQPTHLIHGDVRWDNLLEDTSGTGTRTLKILDWELCTLGDPAWDVGCTTVAILTESMIDLMPRSTSPERGASDFTAVLPRVQGWIREFWDSYVVASAFERASTERLQERVANYAGARLLQSAYEHARGAGSVPRLSAMLLQLGLNILRRPGKARRTIFGLDS